MYQDRGPRGSGKSTRILLAALKEGYNIATYGMIATKHYRSIALDLGVDPTQIRTDDAGHIYVRDVHIAPLSYWINALKQKERKKILVDELTLCMDRVLCGNFAGYSESLEQEE